MAQMELISADVTFITKFVCPLLAVMLAIAFLVDLISSIRRDVELTDKMVVNNFLKLAAVFFFLLAALINFSLMKVSYSFADGEVLVSNLRDEILLTKRDVESVREFSTLDRGLAVMSLRKNTPFGRKIFFVNRRYGESRFDTGAYRIKRWLKK